MKEYVGLEVKCNIPADVHVIMPRGEFGEKFMNCSKLYNGVD